METTEPKTRATRKRGRRQHPAWTGKKRGVWHPDLVDQIKGYPKTQEAFDKLQARSREQLIRQREAGTLKGRKGVPDGFGRQKERVARIRKKHTKEAKELILTMVEQGILNPDEASNEALQFAVSVVRDRETYQARERLAAARLVLDFTKAKPASKQEVTVKRAEDFLAALAGDE